MNSFILTIKGQLSTVDNTEQHKIIEPLCAMIRLVLFSFKPIGTKLSISEHKLSYNEPGYLQGTFRLFNGDTKENLHHLYFPISIACQKFLTKTYLEQCPGIEIIFKIAKRGINVLKTTYNESPIVGHCLDLYLFIIDYHLLKLGISDETQINEYNLEQYINKPLSNEQSQQYLKLTHIWENKFIKIIIDLLNIVSTAECIDKPYYIQTIETFLIPFDNKIKINFGILPTLSYTDDIIITDSKIQT